MKIPYRSLKEGRCGGSAFQHRSIIWYMFSGQSCGLGSLSPRSRKAITYRKKRSDSKKGCEGNLRENGKSPDGYNKNTSHSDCNSYPYFNLSID